METTKPIIELNHVSKVYHISGMIITALDDVSLSVGRGEIFGIIGQSGAGKSTLVRCMNLLERPDSGQVFFEGRDLSLLTPEKLRHARRSMGMVFQQFNLLSQRNALQNVCFPMEIAGLSRRQAGERAEELLNLVGLWDRRDAYPAQLSGGQKQRVAIARALSTSPEALLCDEATSALDPETTKAVLELIREINQKLGITVIVITHEMAVVEAACSRMAVMDRGRVAEEGCVSNLFFNPRSEAGRRLILGEAARETSFGGRRYRITFDGRASSEPVISDLSLSCRARVNILYARTRDLEGKAVGEMVIQLPEEQEEAARVLRYLEAAEVPCEKVEEVGQDGI